MMVFVILGGSAKRMVDSGPGLGGSGVVGCAREKMKMVSEKCGGCVDGCLRWLDRRTREEEERLHDEDGCGGLTVVSRRLHGGMSEELNGEAGAHKGVVDVNYDDVEVEVGKNHKEVIGVSDEDVEVEVGDAQEGGSGSSVNDKDEEVEGRNGYVIVEDIEIEVGEGEEDFCGLSEADDDGVEENYLKTSHNTGSILGSGLEQGKINIGADLVNLKEEGQGIITESDKILDEEKLEGDEERVKRKEKEELSEKDKDEEKEKEVVEREERKKICVKIEKVVKYLLMDTQFVTPTDGCWEPMRNMLGGTSGSVVNIRRTDLTPLAKYWMAFSHANIKPCSHVSDITLSRALFIYYAIRNLNVNIGQVIADEISVYANTSNNKAPLGHPSLITHLCKLVGVDTSVPPFERPRKAIDEAYYRQYCGGEDAAQPVPPRRARRERGPAQSQTSAETHEAEPFQMGDMYMSLIGAQLQSIHRGQVVTAEMIVGMYDTPPAHRWTMDEFHNVVAWPEEPVHGGGAGAAEASAKDMEEDEADEEDAFEDDEDEEEEEDTEESSD
ncbi:hypothetical protein LR48_Vigan02g073900 [Vigna angularis]|uniref:Putative plant transposon protein domain-containing protein n=1 Tax=Phaseolus angularis TaxID=3914 RepID=A0A0L9TWN5_PHAAN|nr:hypothetical protein LR48_Vigan02g073900 [Vigna angularis]